MTTPTATRIALPGAPTATQVLTAMGQEMALSLRGEEDDSRWNIGALATMEVEARAGGTVLVDGQPHVITIADIRQAIGDLVGLESSTVRARQETYEYWTDEERHDFFNLPYSYFRTAMFAPSKESAVKHLRLAQESADDYNGYIMPVRVLRAKVKAARREASDGG